MRIKKDLQKEKMLRTSLIPLLVFTFSYFSNAETPGDYWLNMNESQRVSYLVGYVHGIDTGRSVANKYDGILYEDFFNASPEFKRAILEKTTELYENENNRLVDWKSMIFFAYLELQGENKDILKMRIQMAKEILEPYLGKKKIKQGDYWLQSTQGDRRVYLDGLIEGIQIGMHLEKQKNSRLINLFDDIFNLGEDIGAVADVVTEIVKDEVNRNIEYQFLFPLAYMKYSKTEESIVKEFLKEIKHKIEREREEED